MTSEQSSLQRKSSKLLKTGLLIAFGVGLTLIFWMPLWKGGGLVGGDIYLYYYPQKAFYAERLSEGEFPLWNNRTGHGYPLIGESQTGAFYPFHLVMYRLFDVNRAFNVNHLLHYVFAFVFTGLYAHRLGLSLLPALLSGLVYTYSWFPPRSSMEWAILGGAWLPAGLWCAESFLQTNRRRWAISLLIVLTVQMSAGHFQISWMTQLILLIYLPLRILLQNKNRTNASPEEERKQADSSGQILRRIVNADGSSLRRAAGMLLFVGFFTYALSAVQLLPTWELKGLSQRSDVGEEHDPAYGSIPVWYLSQITCPWHWYSPFVDRDEELQKRPPFSDTTTNQVEAHLYFGFVPLALALYAMVSTIVRRDFSRVPWILIGLAGLVYSTGWLVPVTAHIPGFSFFQGAGRYGIATTMAVAVLSATALEEIMKPKFLTVFSSLYLSAIVFGSAVIIAKLTNDHVNITEEYAMQNLLIVGAGLLSEILMGVWLVIGVFALFSALLLNLLAAFRGLRHKGRRITRMAHADRFLILYCVFAVTISDLWIVCRSVTYTPMTDDAPMNHVRESPVSRLLREYPGEPRLYAPQPNLANLLGVSSNPVYLTFGPVEYLGEGPFRQRTLSTENEMGGLQYDPQFLEELRQSSTTHILSLAPLDEQQWPVTLVRRQGDIFLNLVLWRNPADPVYLYELKESRRRLFWEDGSSDGSAKITEYRANRVTIQTDSPTAGLLVLSDLMYPGWNVTVDGEPAEPQTVENIYRGVQIPAGEHEVIWKYEPSSVFIGGIISLPAFATLIIMTAVCLLRRRGKTATDVVSLNQDAG